MITQNIFVEALSNVAFLVPVLIALIGFLKYLKVKKTALAVIGFTLGLGLTLLVAGEVTRLMILVGLLVGTSVSGSYEVGKNALKLFGVSFLGEK